MNRNSKIRYISHESWVHSYSRKHPKVIINRCVTSLSKCFCESFFFVLTRESPSFVQGLLFSSCYAILWHWTTPSERSRLGAVVLAGEEVISVSLTKTNSKTILHVCNPNTLLSLLGHCAFPSKTVIQHLPFFLPKIQL